MSTTVTTTEALRDLVEPLVSDHELSLFDLELAGGVLRVTVERPGGVGLDEIASLTKAISRKLDEEDPITSRYTLEVSSPGLERTLRTPEHFAWAVGKQVSIKTVPSFEGDRRIAGALVAAGDGGVEVDVKGNVFKLPYGEIERARTVFEWGPAPKPGRTVPKASPEKASTEKKVKAT